MIPALHKSTGMATPNLLFLLLLAGMMRSFDQYGNVMLEDTFERHVVGNIYADERV